MSARRLDARLVEIGLARSRAQARELIEAGTVTVDDRPAVKPSQPVGPEARIVLAREPEPWVGRAAFKLLEALDRWPIPVVGRRCIDVGASTGGFTQVLLARGAAHVVALDVGHGQLVPQIAEDPRVTDLPGTNVRTADADELGRHDLVVTDLSFISVRLVLPVLARLLAQDGDLVLLVKPQFEVGRERLSRTGVVTSRHEHERVLRDVHVELVEAGLLVRGAAPSPILGSDGNREFLLWLGHREAVIEPWDVEQLVEASITRTVHASDPGPSGTRPGAARPTPTVAPTEPVRPGQSDHKEESP